ncbi:23S rRNA pseudouridine synthase D [compost metagenome]
MYRKADFEHEEDEMLNCAGQACTAHGASLDDLIQRQALHASELAFRHPLTGEYMTFHAPFPADMERLQQALANLSQG